MSIDVEQIRSNSRALVQQSRNLAKRSKDAIERAQRLSNTSRAMRQEMQPKPPRKQPRT